MATAEPDRTTPLAEPHAAPGAPLSHEGAPAAQPAEAGGARGEDAALERESAAGEETIGADAINATPLAQEEARMLATGSDQPLASADAGAGQAGDQDAATEPVPSTSGTQLDPQPLEPQPQQDEAQQHTPTRNRAGAGSSARGDADHPDSSPLGQLDSSPASASNSSPSSNRTSSASPVGSSPSSHQSPSRRVKVYRLKDDAWIDLGTGTCSGIFLQPAPRTESDSSSGENGARIGGAKEGEEGEGEEEESAWLVVRKEKAKPAHAPSASGASDGSPVRKGKASDPSGSDPPRDLVEGAAAGNGGGARMGRGEDGDDLDDVEDEEDVILRSRVQPYPLGLGPDELGDEDEVTSVDDKGNVTIDAGGYQRQQETLIVWTERKGGDGAQGRPNFMQEEATEAEDQEMALSFATGSGCSEIWEFIKASRRYLAERYSARPVSPLLSEDALSSPPRQNIPSPSTASLANSLPEPTLGSIGAFDDALRSMSRSAVGRERAASVVVRTGVIEKLCALQRDAEDLESLEDLHALCRVMQQILLLNDNAIFEHVLQDHVILGVVGILEYDPDFPTMRASYRQHLSSPTAYVPVVAPDLLPASLLGKIHQTHRLHYLKDIVLARIIEDSTFSMLNSAIYFNEVDIVNDIAQQRELLIEVFRILRGDASPASEAATKEEDEKPSQLPGSPSKGKERSLALGPKRTIGPDLPDDLLAERLTKRPRVGSSPSPGPGPLSSPQSKPAPAPSSDASGIDPSTLSESERRLHAMLFLQQLAQMAKNLQVPPRTTFFKTMCERGLLSALEGALRFASGLPREEEDTASTIRSAALGVWIAVVDLVPAEVRVFCLAQGKELEARQEAETEKESDPVSALEADLAEEEQTPEEAERAAREKQFREERSTLLGLLICMFRDEEDLGIKAQLTEALRVLVDVTGESTIQPGPRLRPEDPEAERFLQYFYDHCVLSLVQPLLDLPERCDSDPPLKLSAANVAILTHLCDLLCFFVSNHTFRSKYLILSTPALARAIARLLRPKPRLTRHTHLRLAALRFLRACVARSDEFYNRFMIKHDLVRPILETAAEERSKDNLLGSACLEFFENLRTSNVKALLNHLMERCGDTTRKLATATGLDPPLRTFEALIARWEMNNEPPPVSMLSGASARSMQSPSSGATSSSMQRQPSQPGWTPRRELEEESYFNTSDDEDETPAAASTTPGPAEPVLQPALALLSSPSIGMSRRKREAASNPSLTDPSSAAAGDLKRMKSSESVGSAGPLVDYGDDGDSDEEAERKPPTTGALDPLAGGFVRSTLGDDGGSSSQAEPPAPLSEAARVGDASKTEPEASKPSEVDGGASSSDATGVPVQQDVPPPPASSDPPRDDDGAPPFLPSLGSLKRKKEEEDDDGELGLLAKKRAAPTSGSNPPSSPAAAGKGTGLFGSKSAAPTGAGGAATKLGGFKIALGGLKSKIGQGKAGADSGKPES